MMEDVTEEIVIAEVVETLINQYPSNYTEMHESKPNWPQLKEKLPIVFEVIETLKNKQDKSSLILLANLAHNVGVFHTHVVEDYPKALELLSLALDTKKKLQQIDETSLALTYSHLADCAYRNGNTILAITHFNLANEIYKQKENDRNYDIPRAFVLHASGNAYYNIGAYAEALQVFDKAKQLRLKHLSSDDIEFGYLEHDRADVLTSIGLYDESEKSFDSSLQKKKQYFKNPEHTNIALLYQCRALLYIKSQQFEKSATDLKQAAEIYEHHTKQFADANQPDLYRNYFYSIHLQLASGNLDKAESEIGQFELKLKTIEDKTDPVFLRLTQVKIRLFQYQNKLKEIVSLLQKSLGNFIPGLKLELADNISEDSKFDIACLLSLYGVELFIYNNHQNFDECLAILTKALKLKESFYNALPISQPPLGTTNYAFSDYDFGLIYYLSALATTNLIERKEKLKAALNYFQSSKEKLLLAGYHEKHYNVEVCNIQLSKVEELLAPVENKTNLNSYSLEEQSHILFFNAKTLMADKRVTPYPETTLKDYP